MKVEYDEEAGAAYLRLRDPDGNPLRSLESECVFDFDGAGLVGIEILDPELAATLADPDAKS